MYEMPPNDPRVLEMDEGQILHDLAVRRYHSWELRRHYDHTVDAEEEARDPQVVEALRDMEREYTSGERSKQVRAYQAQQRAQSIPTPRKLTVRLRGGFSE